MPLERDLSYYPFLKTFRAPEDIIGGAIWEKEIKRKISKCQNLDKYMTNQVLSCGISLKYRRGKSEKFVRGLWF